MNPLMLLLIAAAVLGASFAGGMRYHAGQDAVKALKEREQREAREVEAKAEDEKNAAAHAKELARLNQQLGNAREQIRHLTTGRDCLSADAVRVLNAAAAASVPAAASQPASAPTAAATDRDVGDALAICRAGYAALADQLNQILDIDERRSKAPP